MKRLLFGLLWIAAAIQMFQALPCKPELAIESKTETSVTLKWTCKDDPPGSLAGYKLRYNIKHRIQHMYFMEIPYPDWTTYTLSGLDAGTTYKFYIEAYDQDGGAVSSKTVEAFLGENEPKEPCKPKLQVIRKTTTSVTLKWECNATYTTPVQSYYLHYHQIDGRHNIIVFDQVQNAGNSHKLTGLTCGQTYQIFVEARDYNGVKVGSETIETNLRDDHPYPSLEEVLEIAETSVTVKLDKWKSNCPTETVTARLIDYLNSSEVATMKTDGSAKIIVLSNLQPDTQYALLLNDGESTWSSAAACKFKTLCTAKRPGLPEKSDALDIGETYAVVRFEAWRCIDRFAAEFRQAGTKPWTSISNDINPEQTSLLIPHLLPEMSYELRVGAYNRVGFSWTFYPFSTLKPTENVCGDWMPYKQKCLKAVPDAGFLTRREAQKVCEELDENGDIPSLITISTKEEQQFVEDMIRNNTGSVWLGLKSADGEEYHWDDGSAMAYTHWATAVVGHGELRCAVMFNNRKDWWLRVPWGHWAKTSCASRNYVACEKPIPMNLIKLQKEFSTIMTHMVRMQKEIKQLQSELILSKVGSG